MLDLLLNGEPVRRSLHGCPSLRRQFLCHLMQRGLPMSVEPRCNAVQESPPLGTRLELMLLLAMPEVALARVQRPASACTAQ